MDSVNILAPGQHGADLLHTIAAGVQGDDIDLATIAAVRQQVVYKLPVILDAGIDKDQLPPPGDVNPVLFRIER